LRFTQRSADVLFGLNFLAWSVLIFVRADEQTRFTIVRFCLASVHGIVGILFLFRKDVQRSGSWKEIIGCVPSVVLGGFAFSISTPINLWPWYANGLFIVGTVITAISLLCLGDNFAIFPTLRDITQHGPYKLVRHPIYFGEYLMLCSCLIASPSYQTSMVVILMVPLLVIRILIEERVLSHSESYITYQERVRWRFIPLIW
jgi:protein-S-isoprenylcysteine O-methyltransferase Ste14